MHRVEAEQQPVQRREDDAARRSTTPASARALSRRQSFTSMPKSAHIRPAVMNRRSPPSALPPIETIDSPAKTARPATMISVPREDAAASSGSLSTSAASTKPNIAAEPGWITPPWASGAKMNPE